MARPLRIEYEGAWYHVMNRGLARQTIFFNDKHREIFLELLAEISYRYRIEIHAYCLMSNHYHLLIRTPIANLSRAMRHLNGIYTQRFNASLKRDGPIFRGRFKSILVEKDVYLLRLSRYIHLNPVAAKIVHKAENFKWSSYRYYITKDKSRRWIFQNDTLAYFGKHQQRRKYQVFVEEGIDKEIDDFFKKIKRLPVLGTEAFTKTVTEKYLKENHKVLEIPDHKQIIECPSLGMIGKTVCNYFNVDAKCIFKPTRGERYKPRAMVMYLGQAKYRDIANYLTATSLTGVSRTIRKMDLLIKNNKKLKYQISEITKQLTI